MYIPIVPFVATLYG